MAVCPQIKSVLNFHFLLFCCCKHTRKSLQFFKFLTLVPRRLIYSIGVFIRIKSDFACLIKRVQKGNAFLLFTHKTSFMLSMSQEIAFMMCLKGSA